MTEKKKDKVAGKEIAKEVAKKATAKAPVKEEKKEVKKEEKKKGKKTQEEIEAEIENLGIIKYPLITEKSVNMIEAENKLVFVVDGKATKPKVKKAIEDLYKVKVSSVNILKDMKARKRALVTIDKKFKADDIATKLGVI